MDSSAEAVVVRLLTDAGPTVQSGRILYTYNWYTSIKLSRKLFEKYNWLFVGTSAPTEKKTGEEYILLLLLVRSPWPHSVSLLGGGIPTQTTAIRTLDSVPL